jgi:hypothetical protein
MAKTKKLFWGGLAALAAACMVIPAGCGDGIMDDGSDDVLYKLAGSWYDSRYDFAFRITQAGEGYIAQSKTQCAVSATGSFVYFRDSRGALMGSFSYSIRNGELTGTLGRGDFSGIQSSSPFIKSGTVPSGGTIPVEYVGKWYAETNPAPSPAFEITKQGLMTISGSAAQYTAVIGKYENAVLKRSILKGTFRSSFLDDGRMIITNGTDLCAGLAFLSRFVKTNT